ncbi:hypothetical protein AUC61_14335 [Pseudomonas sp. S25]|uniref:Uncharacterized protein n=1 Tax=Pseudomonas maioricensis TaxID=1766623 RepID=A0ABS9ZPC2_9PSED|nr:hypothetical protein [Pseudomonas sp. S25]MCI8210713.1 hypothetical protein [Pseudomonas sp. S25]
MSTTQECIYCHTLVAVFSAAFRLGFDPYALAVQAKLELLGEEEDSPSLIADAAERVINESLLVARLRCR